MRFDVLTLFPEMLSAFLDASILKRAQEKEILSIQTLNIRDYAENKHNRVDDAPFGGGMGMLMQAGPIVRAFESIAEGLEYKPHVIYLSPQGQTFCQGKAKELAENYEHIVFLCGHYEGVDQRALDLIVDEEISLGDFVLTGGEIGAVAVIDAVSRLIPGVLSDEECYLEESHSKGILEYPQYTRPREFRGLTVPEVLLNGNHAEIAKWKREQAIRNTFQKRPDLLKDYAPQDKFEQKIMDSLEWK